MWQLFGAVFLDLSKSAHPMYWRQILTVRASCFHSFSSTVWSLAFRAEAFLFVPSVVLVSAGHPQCGRDTVPKSV